MSKSVLGTLIALAFALPDVGFAWVTHLNPVTDPLIPKPAYNAADPLNAAYTDPTFGSKVVRVTGDPGTDILLNGTTNSGVRWAKEVCQNAPYGDIAWNADGSLLMLTGCDRQQTVLLDGNTFKVLRVNPKNRIHGPNLWDHHNPERMYEVGGNTITEYLPRADTGRVLYTFTGYGGLSVQGQTRKTANDGKTIALRATKGGNSVNFCFNLFTGQKGPDIPAIPNQSRDAHITPSGKYVILRGPGGHAADYDLFECATAKKVFEYRLGNQPEHFDTYMWNGREYAVGGGNQVRSMDLLTGEIFAHTPKDSFCEHASTRNYKDGARWAITECGGRSKYFPNEVIAVRIDTREPNIVRRIAYHNSHSGDNFEAEVHVNVSPDGKKIVFASNWQAKSGKNPDAPVHTFVVLLPDWDTPSGGPSGGTTGDSTTRGGATGDTATGS